MRSCALTIRLAALAEIEHLKKQKRGWCRAIS
jgi:hypothetical protein